MAEVKHQENKILTLFEPIIAFLRRFLLFIIVFIFLVVVGLIYYASIDREKIEEDIIEDTEERGVGDTWQETEKGRIDDMIENAVVIRLEDEEGDFTCGVTNVTKIYQKDGESEVQLKIEDLALNDLVEMVMDVTQLEEEATERGCKEIILIEKASEDFNQIPT